MADCRLILGENRKRSRKDGGGVDQDWHKNQPIGLSLPSDSGTMDAENLGSTGYEEMMAAALKTGKLLIFT